MTAVEFAFVLPVLVTMYLGTVEISMGVAIDRKVTLLSRTLADLASQPATITTADMTNILNASASVIAPYDATKLKMTLSEVSIDANGAATIKWSDTRYGTAHSTGQSVSLPAALNVPNTALLWSEVSYAYTPTIGYVVTGTLNLSDTIYMRPRQSDCVKRDYGATSAC
jgi:Flp pilus assembly protein TadG